MHSVVFFALAPIYLLGFFGMGGAFARLLRLPVSPAGKLVLGLAVQVFWGGLLNATGLATALPLYVPLILGLSFGALQIRKGEFGVYRDVFQTRSAKLGWFAIAGVLAFFFALYSFQMLAPDVMNHHDDLANYLTHPAAMLEIGTVYTGPLGSINLQTLGGMAIFHGLVAAPFGLEYVNAADAVFGLLVLLLVLSDVALRRRVPAPAAALVLAAALFISPQYVNISALYLGAALLSALALYPLLFRQETVTDSAGLFSLESGIAAGLIAGALLVLKMSFLVPAFLGMAALAGFIWLSARSVLRGAFWAVGGLAATLVQLAVWLAVQRDRLSLIAVGVSDQGGVPERMSVVDSLWPLDRISSRAPLLYGDGASLGDYHLIVFICPILAAIALAAVVAGRTAYDRERLLWAMFVSLVLSGSWIAFLFLIQIEFFELSMGVRYVVPALVGLFPAFCLAMISGCERRSLRRFMHPSSPLAGGVAALLLCMGAFNDAFWARQTKIYEFGSMLSYLNGEYYQPLSQYTEFVFSEQMNENFSFVQKLTPEGAGLALWLMTPHLADFDHNEVFVVRPGGLGPALSGLDIENGPTTLNAFLQAQGVQFVFWQKSGFGVRGENDWVSRARQSNIRSGVARRALALRVALFELEEGGAIVFENENYVLFRLPPL